MSFDSGVLAAVTLAYLGLLFLLAEAAERGWLPPRLSRHPWVSALSLGVYASTWSYYGSVGFAGVEGYRFLTIYLGVSLACLLVPVVWIRVHRLVRGHQLSSLADLFAFRFRSAGAGVAVTVFLLAGSLPYLAQQIRAVAASVTILTGQHSHASLGLAFTILAAAFAILFGARHVTAREKHVGLVVAIAFESVVKLIALLSVAAFALFGVFDGPSGLADWLRAHPEAIEELYAPVRDGPWGSLLLLSFAAAFLLPRQFHMAFTESHDERSLRTAAWLFPLFLFLLNLTIPIILWAGRVSDPTGNPDGYVLTITTRGGPTWLPIFIFLGGISAASAMVIVSVLALASMCLNHLVLARRGAAQEPDLYEYLRWKRRGLIIVILLVAYGLFLVIGETQRLVELGLVSFVAVAQFLPGLAGVLFWRRASGRAVTLGLGLGIAAWLLFAVLPLLVRSRYLGSGFDLPWLLGVPPTETLAFATFLSLGLNGGAMALASVLRAPRPDEVAMARICIDAGEPLPIGRLDVESPHAFTRALAPVLGIDVAAREVARALADTKLSAGEIHPAELRRLREQLMRNLSGMLGPLAAEEVVEAGLRLDRGARSVGEKLRALEAQAQATPGDPAAELEQVRRYLRDVLEDLPVGVCAVGPDEDVVLWNRVMSEISGVGDQVTGNALARLPAPWGPILAAFTRDPAGARKLTVPRPDGEEGRFHLRKSALSRPFGDAPAGLVVLVEDLTERASLEARLEHHERLALIGQLAASVAHEVGNPLAAIASVAQNLSSELPDADVRQRLQLIRDQVKHISEIVKAMVVYSRAGTSAPLSPPGRFSLAEAVDEAVSLVHLDPHGRAHVIDNQCARDLSLYGDRTRIIQVFINLLHNACDASPAEEAIAVRARTDEQHAIIEIVDHGAGVPPAVRDRIFEPFFTTKEAGKGAGLGLSLVYNIVRDHGGALELDSAAGQGTVVRLSFPREAA